MGSLAPILREVLAAHRAGQCQRARRFMAEAKEKAEEILMQRIEQEGPMIDFQVIELEEANQEAEGPAAPVVLQSEEPAKKRRTYARRKPGEAPKRGKLRTVSTPAAPANGSGAMVLLTVEQVSKLWRIVVGGELVIEGEGVTCQVSAESFNKALPVLLERL